MEPFSPSFFLCYLISIIYGIYFFILSRRKKRDFSLTPIFTLSILMFNISAYALNKTFSVFQESVDWLVVLLIIEQLSLLIYSIHPKLPKVWRGILLVIFCTSTLFNFYQSLVIAPIVPFGLIAFFFLGISLHVMVPFFLGYLCIRNTIRLLKDNTPIAYAIMGWVIPILLVAMYSLQWNSINEKITAIDHQEHLPWKTKKEKQVPNWVGLAQNISFNSITEKILKADLVYSVVKFDRWFDFERNLRFEEQKLHDPLVTCASLFTSGNNLDRETRIKLLDFMYDTRHESSDRFWSGLNLITQDFISNVQFFPEHRMAYTENIFVIANVPKNDKNTNSWRRRQQEALYTFQLPEGSAVTSLSLWIEGKEEKAILTTKSKAETAYNTIVGRERRDPSVVYWKEGNQILVRVFPCTPLAPRKFKLGYTSPLEKKEDKLLYTFHYFKGPDFSSTQTSINLMTENISDFEASINFKTNGPGKSYKGTGIPTYTVEMAAPELSSSPFAFNGNSYQINELKQSSQKLKTEVIYLDLNKQWTKAEITAILELFPDKKIGINSTYYIHPKQLVLNDIDLDNLPNFNLFPFYKLQNKGGLIITKGDNLTPNLHDLEGEPFYQKLFEHFASNTKECFVFDLGKSPTAYIRSLKEFGVLHYQKGSIEQLKKIVESGRFPTLNFTDDAIHIPLSNVTITKQQNETKGTAPDHVLRLFAYNHILQQTGRNFFNPDTLEQQLIDEASIANVVTPMSSLIVLETQKDYDRFGIKANEDGLGNATINGSGAVPEPHEWMLIITGALLLLYLIWKRKFQVTQY